MSERLQILAVATTVPVRPGDGTPGFVLDLAEATGEWADITLLCPRVPGSAASECLGAVHVQRYPYFMRPWEGLADGAILPNLRRQRWRLLEAPFLLVATILATFRACRRYRPDVVHAHWILPAGVAAWLTQKILGVPYVLTIHGADAHALRHPVLARLKDIVVGGAAAALPVSEEIASAFGLPAEMVQPMGVDTAALAAQLGERRTAPGQLLFIGRLAEKKGVDVLLRALAELPDAHLVVLGDGPERERLEMLVDELELRARVDFLGQQPRERVIAELAQALVVVIPSRVAADGDSEGTPVVLAEAMGAGVPVVASRIGGLSEHLRHGESGMLVEPDSPGDLLAALRALIGDPDEASRMGEAARDYVAGRLDMETVAARYRQVLMDAAS